MGNMAEDKIIKEIEKEESKIIKELKKNPWIIGTFVFAIIALILLFVAFKGGGVSKTEIGTKAVEFINTEILQGQGTVTLDSVAEKAGLYEVTVDYNSQKIPTYFTKDGKFYVGNRVDPVTTAASLTGNVVSETPKTVVKSDKTSAELYIFSYCPAGTAALDAFAKAGSLLKNVVDLKVKFFSNMHGEHEKQQNMIQECIQDVAKGKYWDYASQYAAKIYNVCGSSRDIACDKNESIKLMKSVGISSDAVLACVAQKGEKLYAQDQADAGELQLQYSPSVVVNGVYVENADRTPEGLKSLICSGFNTAPTECSQALGTAATTSSGSCS